MSFSQLRSVQVPVEIHHQVQHPDNEDAVLDRAVEQRVTADIVLLICPPLPRRVGPAEAREVCRDLRGGVNAVRVGYRLTFAKIQRRIPGDAFDVGLGRFGEPIDCYPLSGGQWRGPQSP